MLVTSVFAVAGPGVTDLRERWLDAPRVHLGGLDAARVEDAIVLVA